MRVLIAIILFSVLCIWFTSALKQAEVSRHEYIREHGLEAYKRKVNGHRYIKGRKCPACGKETLIVMTKKEQGQEYMPERMRDKLMCDHCLRRW